MMNGVQAGSGISAAEREVPWSLIRRPQVRSEPSLPGPGHGFLTAPLSRPRMIQISGVRVVDPFKAMRRSARKRQVFLAISDHMASMKTETQMTAMASICQEETIWPRNATARHAAITGLRKKR